MNFVFSINSFKVPYVKLYHMFFLFRPANEFSCKPICKMIKRKHSSKKSEDGQKHHHISHNSHLHKKLPSFMASKQEDKIFDFTR